jgi:hypothetical protein
VELRLVADSRRRRDRVRQIGVGRQLGGDAGRLCGLHLALDVGRPLAVLDVHIVVGAFEIALDAVLRRDGRHLLDRLLVGARVAPCGLLAERVNQPAVHEAVADGQLGGRVAGRAEADQGGLHQRDCRAGLLEQVSGRRAGDAGADHRDVDRSPTGQRRIGRVRILEPEWPVQARSVHPSHLPGGPLLTRRRLA